MPEVVFLWRHTKADCRRVVFKAGASRTSRPHVCQAVTTVLLVRFTSVFPVLRSNCTLFSTFDHADVSLTLVSKYPGREPVVVASSVAARVTLADLLHERKHLPEPCSLLLDPFFQQLCLYSWLVRLAALQLIPRNLTQTVSTTMKSTTTLMWVTWNSVRTDCDLIYPNPSIVGNGCRVQSLLEGGGSGPGKWPNLSCQARELWSWRHQGKLK